MGWCIHATAPPGAGGRFRALERVVTDRFGPALRDPVVREHAVSCQLVKRPGSDANPPSAELILFAPGESESVLAVAVERHAGGDDLARAPLARDDPAVHPVFREYLEGVADVTAIALDLHLSGELARHQCFLIDVGCRAEDPRFALHPYLLVHSAAYRDRSGADPSGSWSWAHERFWARCYTPGPDRTIGAPLTSLWNIVLGATPRRGDTPAALAKRLAISCG